MKRIIIPLILISLLLFVGCKQKQVTNNNLQPQINTINEKQVEDFKAIKNPERKEHKTFSITMPGDWKEIEYGLQIIYLPKDSEAVDPLAEKISVVVRFIPENNTVGLKEMLDAGISDTKKLMPDFKVTSTTENFAFGKIDDGIKLEMTSTIQGKTMTYTQISGIAFNRMYAIAHSCIKDECKYTDIYYEMVDSFLETGQVE
jgi:hypothetical protein